MVLPFSLSLLFSISRSQNLQTQPEAGQSGSVRHKAIHFSTECELSKGQTLFNGIKMDKSQPCIISKRRLGVCFILTFFSRPQPPQPVPQPAVPTPLQQPSRMEHLPEWRRPGCVRPPPCLVSLRLIIELRLGCSPSHPDIQRWDPPPASRRLLPGFPSPPTLSLLLPLLNSILSPADFSSLWSLLSILQIVTSLGFRVLSSQKCLPFSSSLPHVREGLLPRLIVGVSASFPSGEAESWQGEQRPDFCPDLSPG